MSLVACSRFLRPSIARLRPALSPARLCRVRRFSSVHQKDGSDGQDNMFVVLGLGVLGAATAVVSNGSL